MELWIRLGAFVMVFSLMLLWEWRRPFRAFEQKRSERLLINVGLMLTNFIFLRLLSGGGAFLAAVYAGEHGIGLFNRIDLPPWVSGILSLLILDCAIYFQHRVFHRVPLLWRIHRVHHCDMGFDTSTAVRFHGVEIVLSMYYKIILVVLLGVSPWTVILFEIILNACALFNHGNVRLPGSWDRRLRLLLITPDMHRIHHSSIVHETNSNYGFSVPWWDRLFGTYCPNPALGHAGMGIGLPEERDPGRLNFFRLLVLPLEKIGDRD